MKKTLFSAFLAMLTLLLCLSLLPGEVEAAVVDSGTCGDNLTWTLDDNGLLMITGSGEMRNFYNYGDGRVDTPWFAQRNSIKTIIIADGVTSIGEYAFYNCAGLAGIMIPETVTSIGCYAFNGCTSLTSITIPDGVTSIEYGLFRHCANLTAVTIPASVTSIQAGAFERCAGLTSVIIPDGVTSIENYTFYNCTSLSNVKIPEGVTCIREGAFANCWSLSSVVIPEGVGSIGMGAFLGCTSLMSVTIPGSVTSIGNEAFGSCTRLTSVTISEGVTRIGCYSFSCCMDLNNVTIPNSVTSIGSGAFDHCHSLTSVVIPEGVTCIEEDTFAACYSLADVTIPDSVTSIGKYAFLCCSRLTNLTIPDSVTSIGIYAFADCTGLTSVTIPESIGCIEKWTFQGCTNLTDVILPVGLTNIGDYAFSGCSSLSSMVIPDTVTSIGSRVFEYCKNPKLTFTGNAPNLKEVALHGVRAAYYPENAIGWDALIAETSSLKWIALKMVVITEHPADVAVKSGEIATVTVGAEGSGLIYEWYYANKGSDTFVKTNTFKSNTYSVTMNSQRNGRRIYCVVTDENGVSRKTKTVTLTMKTPLRITSQPTGALVANGQKARVKISATGDGLTYTWFYAGPDSDQFSVTRTFAGNHYTVIMNEKRDGRRVYCVITDKYGETVTTDTMTLHMCQVIAQPVVDTGEQAKVTIVSRAEGLTYRWYYANKGSNRFLLTNTIKGSTYAVSMNAARDGRRIYCVVTDKYGNSFTTETVTLKKYIPLEITHQPTDAAAVYGAKAKVSVTAKGEGLTYQWYYANKGRDTFTLTTAFKGSSYTVTMNDARNGRRVYCVITDEYGNTVTTDVVTISMLP